MVLTNFECWAYGGALNHQGLSDNLFERPNRVDFFNPSAISAFATFENNNNQNIEARNVSHISSNGYYGFANVNNSDKIGNDVNAGVVVSPQSKSGGGTETDEMMDVPQHSCNNAAGNTFSTDFRQQINDERRKRFHVEEDFVAANKFNSKRLRVDDGNESARNCNGASEHEMDCSFATSGHVHPSSPHITSFTDQQQLQFPSGAAPSLPPTSIHQTESQQRNNSGDLSRFSDHNEDNLLENLFLLTHGGDDYQMWRHMQNEKFILADI